MSAGKWIACAAALAVTLAVTKPTPAANQPVERGAQPPGLVSQIKVLPDKAPDCSSLEVDRRHDHAGLQDERREGHRHLQLHAVGALPPRLSGRTGRSAGAEGDQLLRLEPVRRFARRAIGAVAPIGLGLAVRGLGRTHHGRSSIRRPLALPGRVPEVLRLDARPQRAGRPDHRRGRRPEQQRRRNWSRTPSSWTRPASASTRGTTSSPATGTSSTGRPRRSCPAATNWTASSAA